MKIGTLIVFAAVAITSLHAQQEGAKQPSRPAVFRFEYTLTELSGKQKINARKFEILTTERGSLKAYSKVAVPIAGSAGTPTAFTYVELGLSADMRSVAVREGMISLYVEVSETFVVPPEPSPSGTSSAPPTSRDVRMQTATEVKPGVPTVLGIVEDVASTHSFELSVTATPL